MENCTTSINNQDFHRASFCLSLVAKTLKPIKHPSEGRITVCLPQRGKPELGIRAAAKRSENVNHVKDLRMKRPRDFSKSQAPIAVERPSPQHAFGSFVDSQYIQLKPDQAIGHIVSAQANFMRVIVEKSGSEEMDSSIHLQELDAQKGAGIRTHMTGETQDDAYPAAATVKQLNSEMGMGAPHDSQGVGEDGKFGIELLCVVRALLKKIKKRVMVGDKVLVSGIDWIDGRGMIEEVFDRMSETSDPPVANVDQIIVLSSLDRPRTEPLSLSRFLVEAESTGIPFVVVFNKTDLVSLQDVSEWKNRLNSWGYEPLFCSASMRSGVEPLITILMKKTTVIIGPSGVGKSSIINALGDQPSLSQLGSEGEAMGPSKIDAVGNQDWEFEEQMVGDVSERTGRGKHTTRNVNLLKVSNDGYLADTPGFSQPSLAQVTTKSLPHLFPEIRNRTLEEQCAFSDCLHIGEPNCVVGGDWERYAHYLQLLEELRKREEMELKTFGTKRESDMRYKVKAFGVKQAEPRLTPKKHRRVSRQRKKRSLSAEVAEEVEELGY